MKQRRATWILGLVVAGLVGFGGWKWTTRRAVERTVNVFLAAMIQGDAETLLEYLDGPALEAYLAKSPKGQAEFAAPIPDATSEIREIHLNGGKAEVRVLWKVSGFDIWSDLELAKSDTGYWKITNIHQPDMVPTWEQVQEKIAEENPAKPLHESLAEKLEGREGVEVRPLHLPELDH